MLTINEIFHSIQGESTRAGQPCVFVRLTACDLRCTWCDTPYAFHEGHKMSVDEVVERVGRTAALVEITGGEPLLQEDVYPLMERLLATGHTVMLETGGHRASAGCRRRGPVVDVKCPAAARPAKNDWATSIGCAPHDEVKFVIKDRADYEFARDGRRAHDLAARAAAVLFSPVHGVLDPKKLAAVDARRPPARPPAAAGAQVHLGSRRRQRGV